MSLKDDPKVQALLDKQAAASEKELVKALKAETKRCADAVKSMLAASDDKDYLKGFKDAQKAAVNLIKNGA